MSKKVSWKKFGLDAGVRAVKTFAQTALGLVTASSVGLIGVDWVSMLSVAGLATLASILTSVSSLDSIGEDGTLTVTESTGEAAVTATPEVAEAATPEATESADAVAETETAAPVLVTTSDTSTEKPEA